MGIYGNSIKPNFRCFYEVRDNNEVQIINNKGQEKTNEEIESKIKILNDNQMENLLFKKKFDYALLGKSLDQLNRFLFTKFITILLILLLKEN